MTEYLNRRTGEIVELHKDKLLTPDGKEIPDPLPLAPPVGYVKRDSLAEQIRQMVLGERLAQEARAAGAETFDEADDFDVGDDYDPTSPYEALFDPMTPEESAALRSQGRDVDAILGPPPPKPKKRKKAAGDQPDDRNEDSPEGSESSEAEGET